METHEVFNPNLSVEMEDNSNGKESQHSRPNYNRPEMLQLSNRYTNSRVGLNPDLSVEMEDNSIGKESHHSWPDYNHPETLHLSNRCTNSRG
jgi:hypothetical protein